MTLDELKIQIQSEPWPHRRQILAAAMRDVFSFRDGDKPEYRARPTQDGKYSTWRTITPDGLNLAEKLAEAISHEDFMIFYEAEMQRATSEGEETREIRVG